jgi:hypothetical protein
MFSPTATVVVQDGREPGLPSCRPYPAPVLTALAGLFLTGAVTLAEAGPVAWGSRAFLENKDSRENLWGPGFEMTLGVFAAGFTPTAGNVTQWAAHWHQLDKAEFDPEEYRFGGLIDHPEPLPPTHSTQVHVWVRNHHDAKPGAEWLLLTHPEWQWPGTTAGTVARPVTTWIADEHSVTLLGTVGGDGAVMATAAVGPASGSLAGWLELWFPDGGPNRLADADPDGDGMSNRLEYFLGTDPSRAGKPVAPAIVTVAGGLRLSLDRNPAVPSLFAVETSTDLLTWSAAAHSVIEERPDFIEIEVPKSDDRSFFRIQLSLPTEP